MNVRINFEKIAQYWKEAIVLVGLLVCVALLWILKSQSETQLRQLQGQYQSNEQQMNQLQATLNQTPTATPQQIETAKLRLPTTMDVTTVLRETSTLARSAGVTVSTFQFSPVPPSQGDPTAPTNGSATVQSSQSDGLSNLVSLGLQAYPVSVTVDGPMPAVLRFINGLQHYPRLTIVQSATWQRFGGQAEVSLLFNVYVDPSGSAS